VRYERAIPCPRRLPLAPHTSFQFPHTSFNSAHDVPFLLAHWFNLRNLLVWLLVDLRSSKFARILHVESSSFDSTTMSSTPKTPKGKIKVKDKRISTPVIDSGSERNVTPKPKPRAMKTEPFAPPTPSEGGGNPLWLVLFTVIAGLIGVLVVRTCIHDLEVLLATNRANVPYGVYSGPWSCTR